MHQYLEDIAGEFKLLGDFAECAPYGNGHINDTFALTMNQGGTPVRYILQRINRHVFRDIEALMTNVERVTQHLQRIAEEDPPRCALTLVPTRDGRMYHVAPDGSHWRSYVFIEYANTHDTIHSVAQARQAARAFGRFICELASLPGEPLVETIPDFHNTRMRFDTLQAVVDADPCERTALAATEIASAQDREPMVDTLINLQRDGTIPTLTTHNDTKLNNVLMDTATGEPVCVIDLDTVMPGLALYDFGDMARTALRPCEEDEPDASRAVARMDMFEAITQGYLETAGAVLTPVDVAHLAFSARLITFEIGLRFLADYLQGDVYFKTHRPNQNLDRARVQFAMVNSMEEKAQEMESIVQDLAAEFPVGQTQPSVVNTLG